MISGVVLTHNDAHCISRTLTSIGWCDEIIVVDDGSTDKTVELAKKHGAKVYKRQLNNDFAAQRNFGLSKVKGEWVLFVDSDEVVPQLLKDEIQEHIRVPGDCVGFFLRRQDFLYGHALKHGETATVRLLRLAKKGFGKWRRPVHEVWNIEGTVGELSESLHHYPHPNVAQFLAEIDRYSTVNAHVFYSHGVRSSMLTILLYPSAKFFLNYFIRRGFLDGMPGAIVAFMMSFHSFLTRAKLYVLANKHKE